MKKNFQKKSCVICGEIFTPKCPSEKCCSDDYKAMNIKLNKANQRKETILKRKSNRPDWAEIHRKCEAAGLSYGEAVARGII